MELNPLWHLGLVVVEWVNIVLRFNEEAACPHYVILEATWRDFVQVHQLVGKCLLLGLTALSELCEDVVLLTISKQGKCFI